MLDQLNFEDFTPRLKQAFHLQLTSEAALTLELSEAKKLGVEPTAEDDFRQAFSLVFLGPLEPLLPQRIYELAHPEMGILTLFLVPLGPDKTGQIRYEAVFT